ncbi:Uncharacterised protein [Candidatus Norongarragalina meridionalis]|nr:Uncharacterised protein [Candidatus Norongarragalina meridionalis]
MDVLCDSSSLIALAETCNVEALEYLTQRTKARFLITTGVRDEIIARPLNIRQYAFSAVRLRNMVERGVLEVTEADAAKAEAIMADANAAYSVGGRTAIILHRGEAECLACAKGALLIDEKTARLLVENPEKLRASMEVEYRQSVRINKARITAFREKTKGTLIIRSAELLAMAHRNGFFFGFGERADEAFHAALYSLRQSGCSISGHELEDYQKI